MAAVSRTQVGIVGAGPAGLTLAMLLDREGIDSRIVELRNREYVEGRIRAGLLEQGTVDLLTELGVDERLRRQGFCHSSFEVRVGGRRHHVPMAELADGSCTWMYGQQEVVKDLIAALEQRGREVEFEATDARLAGLDTDRPTIEYRCEGAERVLACDLIAGCDGFHGVARQSFPKDALTTFSQTYPFAWFGFLADAPPATTEELIYASHPNGFALHSFRSTELSRLYFQVSPDEDPDSWGEEQIWAELRRRFHTDDEWQLNEGPIRQKAVTAMRCFVSEPMQHGNLFLAGDSAHIVPPTAAKGLNLAISDVRLLAQAIISALRDGDRSALDAYSEVALHDVWDVQSFSWEMTNTFHHLPGDSFAARVQEAQLQRLCTSPGLMRGFCESYTGVSRRLGGALDGRG